MNKFSASPLSCLIFESNKVLISCKGPKESGNDSTRTRIQPTGTSTGTGTVCCGETRTGASFRGVEDCAKSWRHNTRASTSLQPATSLQTQSRCAWPDDDPAYFCLSRNVVENNSCESSFASTPVPGDLTEVFSGRARRF